MDAKITSTKQLISAT